LIQACGGNTPESAAPKSSGPPSVTDVERYCPLKADTVYQFETFSENTGEKGVLMMSVDRPTSKTATLMVGGRSQRLELDPAGIRLATGGWLLKAPLSAGARFRGQFGEVVVMSIDRAIEVPAGKFKGCVETKEESTAVQKRVTTVFCPDVGIVLLEAEGALGEGDFGRERASLKSHGPRVDINAPPPPEK
jgi:hypothetical protein